MGPVCPAAAAAKSIQLCLTLCNPIDGSPPGSPGILQARVLEWVAIAFPVCPSLPITTLHQPLLKRGWNIARVFRIRLAQQQPSSLCFLYLSAF